MHIATKILKVVGFGAVSACGGALSGLSLLMSGMLPSRSWRHLCWKISAVSGVISVFSGYKSVKSVIRRRPKNLLEAWPKR